MAAESEKIYECQVKRRRVKVGGGYEPFWKLKSVAEAVIDADTEFRCSDCTGAVKLHRRHIADAPPPHIAHKLKTDSECTHEPMKPTRKPTLLRLRSRMVRFGQLIPGC